MAMRLALLLLVVGMGVVCSQSGDFPSCTGDIDPAVPFSELDATNRFCQASAVGIRNEYFYCRGTYRLNDNDEVELIPGTQIAPLPDSEEGYWTVILQYPALSYMDVARKSALFIGIQELLSSSGCSVSEYRDFCVSDAFPIYVAEYRESVIITLYNLGNDLSGTEINTCFNRALSRGDSRFLGRFRGRQALIINLDDDLTLNDMFNLNIGPGSSIGDPADDPTLRAVILTSFAGNATEDEARDRISSSSFASNPNPINYGLEAGDIVFAVFGSILLIILSAIILLGFFIHPFFLS